MNMETMHPEVYKYFVFFTLTLETHSYTEINPGNTVTILAIEVRTDLCNAMRFAGGKDIRICGVYYEHSLKAEM